MGMLTQEDAAQIEAAIQKAEARSAGELVVAVVPRCARYGEERLLTAAAWGVVCCLAGQHLLPEISCRLWIAAQLPVTLALYGLLRLPALLRLLVRRQRMQTAVQARAWQIFSQRGIYKTRDRTGLLVLISEAEHQVVILGDAGVDATVGADGWSRYVQQILTGIHAGNVTAALVQVIDELGTRIAAHHPRRDDDGNELPDAVVDA